MTREQIEARFVAQFREHVTDADGLTASERNPSTWRPTDVDCRIADVVDFCAKLVAELQSPPPDTTEDEDYDAYATAYNDALEEGETAADLAVIRMFREREARLRQRLQAPPTGEAVEKAERSALLAVASAIQIHTDGTLPPSLAEIVALVRDYGAACRAAGRAEAMAEKTTKGAK